MVNLIRLPHVLHCIFRSIKSHIHLITLLLTVVANVLLIQIVTAGDLVNVTPMGASSGYTIQITGTDFNDVPGLNLVTFIPVNAAPISVIAKSVSTIDPLSGVKRLAVVVPYSLPVGSVALHVQNIVTNELSEGESVDIIRLVLPEHTSAPRGAVNLNVRINCLGNCNFIEGKTRATWGIDSGVVVNSTTVESSNSLIANISVASDADPGMRQIAVVTRTTTSVLPNAFLITP